MPVDGTYSLLSRQQLQHVLVGHDPFRLGRSSVELNSRAIVEGIRLKKSGGYDVMPGRSCVGDVGGSL